MSDRIFCFLDLETTGLDHREDEILEIAWAFTDPSFNVIGVPFQTVVEPDWGVVASRLRENPYVKAMHEASGLSDDLDAAVATINDVHAVLEVDIACLPPHESLHLAGFSVHFDKGFLLARGFGELFEEQFHHRLLDLSATKLLLESASVPYETPVNHHPHRAYWDVSESIAQARIFAALVRGDVHVA